MITFSDGCWIKASSPSQFVEVEKDLSFFQEVDLGEGKSRGRHRSADKENVPPPTSSRGLKRLAASPDFNESTVSIVRGSKAYRPPTPPRPSGKRTSAPSTPVTTNMNKTSQIVYPDLVGLGTETNSQRTRSPDDDTTETRTLRTARSSLTMWTENRRVSISGDACTLTDDDDRTLPVYQPHSVRKSTIGSKSMLVVDPKPESGFWKKLKLWFDSLLNSFKSCLSGH